MPNVVRESGGLKELLQGHLGEVEIGPAADREQLERAYELVYLNYVQRGYIGENETRLRFSVFNAFPETATFVAMLHDRLVATVTLVDDTPAGLPMDEIYHEELQALRDRGRHVTEVTMLADRRLSVSRSFFMLIRLMKLVFDYTTLHLRANDMCITVNPHHDKFYQEYLLFAPMGGLRAYPSVANNPALARRLDLDAVRDASADHPNLLKHFYENRTPIDRLRKRYTLSDEDLEYFFVSKSHLFAEAPEYIIRHLRAAYPSLDWARIRGRGARS
jgi:hypothetical protein